MPADFIGPKLPPTYGDQFEEVMKPAYDAAKKAAEDRYASTVEMVNQAITQVQQQTNPIAPTPAPEGPNPAMAGLAGFFAHLNQAQGGGGAAVAGLQNTLAHQQAMQETAVQQNLQSERAFSLSKFGSTEELHRSLLTAKRDESAELGDLDKTFQHNKALFALDRQAKQEAAKGAQELADSKEKTKQKGAIDRINLRGAISEKNIRVAATLRKDASARATTPAQKARLSMVNAEVAELRASVNDYRSARDVSGEPLYSEQEIDARETEVGNQIRAKYQAVIEEFKTGKTDSPAPAPPASKVQSAAERLRSTPLFQ